MKYILCSEVTNSNCKCLMMSENKQELNIEYIKHLKKYHKNLINGDDNIKPKVKEKIDFMFFSQENLQ